MNLFVKAALFALALTLVSLGADSGQGQALDRAAIKRNRTAIERKLNSVIIPKVEFQQTPLRDAIEFLRQEFRRLDTQDKPGSRGVSIFLKLKRPDATARPVASDSFAGARETPGTLPPDSASPRITLSLSNVSFLAALRAVASQAGLKVKVETYAVAILPVDELTDALITAEFRVAPTVFGVPAALEPRKGGNVPFRFDVRSWLEKQGITFPPGAYATYSIATKKLVAHNTEENIDRIELLVTTPNPGK